MAEEYHIMTLTVQEATERLRAMGVRISPDTLRDGIRQNIFPFGDHIETKAGNPVYLIYEKLFNQWAAQRAQ